MASLETWAIVEQYFNPNSTVDKFGDIDKIDDEVLLRTFFLRKQLGLPIIITAGYATKGHSQNSQHYKGKALDFVIPDYSNHIIDLILLIERFGFRGIGYYTFWQYNGRTVPGFHVDTRDLSTARAARWMGVLELKKTKASEFNIYQQKTVGLSYENIVKYTQQI